MEGTRRQRQRGDTIGRAYKRVTTVTVEVGDDWRLVVGFCRRVESSRNHLQYHSLLIVLTQLSSSTASIHTVNPYTPPFTSLATMPKAAPAKTAPAKKAKDPNAPKR